MPSTVSQRKFVLLDEGGLWPAPYKQMERQSLMAFSPLHQMGAKSTRSDQSFKPLDILREETEWINRPYHDNLKGEKNNNKQSNRAPFSSFIADLALWPGIWHQWTDGPVAVSDPLSDTCNWAPAIYTLQCGRGAVWSTPLFAYQRLYGCLRCIDFLEEWVVWRLFSFLLF